MKIDKATKIEFIEQHEIGLESFKKTQKMFELDNKSSKNTYFLEGL